MKFFIFYIAGLFVVLNKSPLALAQGELTSSEVAGAHKFCPSPWLGAKDSGLDCRVQEMEVGTYSILGGTQRILKVQIRSGYLPENPQTSFKGNVIYYEGLGDSMVNHMPLFTQLTTKGYRVIAFDYMGQGGSSGSMNDTRISEISVLGDKIWTLYAREIQAIPTKIVIGWSTGGLAAYVQTLNMKNVDKVILIAPGISPNKIVGEQRPYEFKFNLITLPTLTTQKYTAGIENPHVEPIKPTSPLEVPEFSLDLIQSSHAHRSGSVSKSVRGFVLLSGPKDTYVNADKTSTILRSSAPHFKVQVYDKALHEIDNEAEPTRSKAHQDILHFIEE